MVQKSKRMKLNEESLRFHSRPGAAVFMATRLQARAEVQETVFNITVKHMLVARWTI